MTIRDQIQRPEPEPGSKARVQSQESESGARSPSQEPGDRVRSQETESGARVRVQSQDPETGPRVRIQRQVLESGSRSLGLVLVQHGSAMAWSSTGPPWHGPGDTTLGTPLPHRYLYPYCRHSRTEQEPVVKSVVGLNEGPPTGPN